MTVWINTAEACLETAADLVNMLGSAVAHQKYVASAKEREELVASTNERQEQSSENNEAAEGSVVGGERVEIGDEDVEVGEEETVMGHALGEAEGGGAGRTDERPSSGFDVCGGAGKPVRISKIDPRGYLSLSSLSLPHPLSHTLPLSLSVSINRSESARLIHAGLYLFSLTLFHTATLIYRI
jgi:hypothetical protein